MSFKYSTNANAGSELSKADIFTTMNGSNDVTQAHSFSRSAVLLTMSCNSTELATGSGVIARDSYSHLYLITAWHNLSGKRPGSNNPISKSSCVWTNLKLDGLKPSSLLATGKQMLAHWSVRRQRRWFASPFLVRNASAWESMQRRMFCARKFFTELDNSKEVRIEGVISISSIKTMIAIRPACDEPKRAEFAQLVLHCVKRESAYVRHLAHVTLPCRRIEEQTQQF